MSNPPKLGHFRRVLLAYDSTGPKETPVTN